MKINKNYQSYEKTKKCDPLSRKKKKSIQVDLKVTQILNDQAGTLEQLNSCSIYIKYRVGKMYNMYKQIKTLPETLCEQY